MWSLNALRCCHASATLWKLPNVKGLRGPLGCLNQARYGIAWGAVGAAM